MVTHSSNIVSNIAGEVVVSSDRNLLHEEDVRIDDDRRVLIGRSYISWGAVIAGALTALSLLVLSGIFAYACGVPAYRNGGPFGLGAGLWMVISSIIAFFIGGSLVSYLSPHSQQRLGLVHGALAWVLGIMLLAFSSTSTIVMFHGMNIIEPLATEATHAQLLGAAWSAFLSLALGLIAAAIGGLVSYTGDFACVKK